MPCRRRIPGPARAAGIRGGTGAGPVTSSSASPAGSAAWLNHVLQRVRKESLRPSHPLLRRRCVRGVHLSDLPAIEGIRLTAESLYPTALNHALGQLPIPHASQNHSEVGFTLQPRPGGLLIGLAQELG